MILCRLQGLLCAELGHSHLAFTVPPLGDNASVVAVPDWLAASDKAVYIIGLSAIGGQCRACWAPLPIPDAVIGPSQCWLVLGMHVTRVVTSVRPDVEHVEAAAASASHYDREEVGFRRPSIASPIHQCVFRGVWVRGVVAVIPGLSSRQGTQDRAVVFLDPRPVGLLPSVVCLPAGRNEIEDVLCHLGLGYRKASLFAYKGSTYVASRSLHVMVALQWLTLLMLVVGILIGLLELGQIILRPPPVGSE